MLLIPAIDLKDGHCVRLKQGEMDDATVFSEDPGAMARHWLDAGALDPLKARVRLIAGLGAGLRGARLRLPGGEW
mgnify:CR=1 FL=1